ncbi:LysM domain-containing protein [Natranaerovirga hydrolytica]|uniref:LysM domain-containing protein n=1 Tax=Natranaerovirga hydrolytica TaxID=680378 RepID=A0A4R1MPP0_9FIRM|nr:SPOCS domain-containing protein [Natranaerovirga hydrolytica]TCK93284.1 LysM domain-containing protein [Natranaerovirga hydrolytica]
MALNLIKKHIQMTQTKGNSIVQVNLDDDFNVPDIKPDVQKIIQEHGEIKINNVDVMDDKVKVKGEMECTILYLTDSDEKPVHSLNCLMPFEEVINLDGIQEDDDISIRTKVENLSTNIINSRKLSAKSIVELEALAEDQYFINVATDIEGEQTVQNINEEIKASQIFLSKKDTYRVRDELAIPNSKPNIMEILWTNAHIRNPEIRLIDDRINIKGDVALFVLYIGETDDKPVEFVEFELPFNGSIDCEGCTEEMIADITMRILKKDVQIRPDLDGEERVLDVEIITELEIKVYEQENINILKDVYSPSKEILIKKQPVTYENIMLKNQTQCKITEKLSIKKDVDPYILQICQTEGDIKIDDIEMREDGLEVEGVINVQIIYVAADDKTPINVIKDIIPYNHTIDAKGINEQCIYKVKPTIDYISCNMLDDQEVEIRCGVNLDTIVFEQISKEVMVDIEEQDLDKKKIYDLPSIVGYIVKKDETLWDIAKKYYTTTDKIKDVNGLTEDYVLKPGDKLIIMKNIETIVNV